MFEDCVCIVRKKLLLFYFMLCYVGSLIGISTPYVVCPM